PSKNLKKYVKFAKIQIKIVVVDFIGDLDEGVKKIEETIEGLDVGILINNVGISTKEPKNQNPIKKFNIPMSSQQSPLLGSGAN
ncbi:hypothetical protein Golob_001349, partial [Gossypium lobatum]|nr:hypothetical protein [Gossypium lobatum]